MRILFLGVLVAALDIAILAPSLRSIGEYFAVDNERTLAWVFIIFTLFTQLGIPFMSWLSDVYGRRFAYVLCLVFFTAGLIVVIAGSTFGIVLLGRAIQGIGVSGIVPVTSAVIGDIYPMEKRGRMLGIVGAVFGIAFIIGPILSGLLIPYGWQWPFGILVPIAMVVGVLGYRQLPASQVDTAPSLDLWGILSLLASISMITLGISRLETEHLGQSVLSIQVWPFLVGAVCFMGAFIFVEKRVSKPFIRLELFASRQISLACLISVGAGMTEAVFVFLPSFAYEVFGVSDRAASMMLMPLVLALAIGAPLTGRLVDRIGAKRIVQGGTFFVALGMGLLAVLVDQQVLYYTGIACVGFGLSALLGSSISYILLNEARVSERTLVQGVSRLFKGFGRLVGGAMIGAIVASATLTAPGYGRAFLVVAIAAVLLLVVSFGLRSRQEEQAVFEIVKPGA